MPKNWLVATPPPAEFFAEHPELPAIMAQLVWNRGLKTQTAIDEFLNPDYGRDVPDPFLFRDMPAAVELIFDCLATDKKIVVHGDYDADGVDAAALLVLTLKKLGGGRIEVFIPHRETDGYGLNRRTVEHLHANGAALIITCDCGISNAAEVERARELGLKVIITDHHAMPLTLPAADAILHPLVPGETYPDKTLSGGGVAFKLAQALLKKHRSTHTALPDGQSHEAFEKWLLDLVAISSVADMVPLRGETRTLVRYGLTVLGKTRNPGLRQLLKQAGLMDERGAPKRGPFTTQTIAFQIAPRLNAAGRMNHANVAFKLLVAEDDATARALAAELDQNNTDRQKLTDKLMLAARYQAVAAGQETEPLIVVVGDNWPIGILGILASRLKDEFSRPTVVLSRRGNDLTGSGRSVPGFNLIENLKALSEWFSKFGGHPMAAGFTLRQPAAGISPEQLVNDFTSVMRARAKSALAGAPTAPEFAIEAIVDLDDVDWKLYDRLQKFEPFGVGNEEPAYAAYGVTVLGVEAVGSDRQHLRLLVKHRSHVVRKTIAFGFGDPLRHPADWKGTLQSGDKLDLAFTVGVNEWNGNRELQLQIKDLKRAA